MGKIGSYFKGFFNALKVYCENSSCAGVSYITNNKLHFSERIFWLICITVSAYGSYTLIKDYRDSFQQEAISLVVESIRPQEKTKFPSLGICELGYVRGEYDVLEQIVENLNTNPDFENENDIEDFLMRIVFQNLYSFGALSPYCLPPMDCPDKCMQCPVGNYSMYANMIRASCTELFVSCLWNGKPFDCCQYLRPLQTTMGKCFLLNSIQNNVENGPHWLDNEIGWDAGNGEIILIMKNSVAIHFLNEEDVPHMLLSSLQVVLTNPGYDTSIQLQVQNVINDDGIQDVDPSFRKCRFPSEQSSKSIYKYYSFSTCVTDCLKAAQLTNCNCTNYNMIGETNDNSPPCDLMGFLCLDANDLIYPPTTIMQPWQSNGLVCNCVPSCEEHEITIVESSYFVSSVTENRKIKLGMQALPTQRYRRQLVRNNLDVVVSIGGILGLFLGASILSGIELIYFFTARLCGNFFAKNVNSK